MRSILALLTGVVAALALAASAGATTGPSTHGQLLQIRANTNQSSNWFGYNQGTLEQGSKLFTSITGDWTVPAATPAQRRPGRELVRLDRHRRRLHRRGLHGRRLDAHPDGHRAGRRRRRQRVVLARGGSSSPAPSIAITNMTVAPGDRMHASISELVPLSDVWTIVLQDVTRGESFTQIVPYPSTQLTAEWIEETPLLIGTDAGFASLPNLANPVFDNATTNGAAREPPGIGGDRS